MVTIELVGQCMTRHALCIAMHAVHIGWFTPAIVHLKMYIACLVIHYPLHNAGTASKIYCG